MTALSILDTAETVPCPPCARSILSPPQWAAFAAALPAQPELGFIALWADAHHVHALFWCGGPRLASVAVEAGLYAALSPARPGAALFERMVADLWGHQSADAADVRPWLDHGTWPQLRPLADRPAPNAGAPEVPEMPDPGDTFGTLGLGPLPPSPLPSFPAHWRATLDGDTMRGLEARLGYAHRGLLGLMRGKSPPGAAKLAARIGGAATVAHSTAFARAVEAAMDTPAPPRAEALRGAMLAIERIAVTLHDLHETAAACALPAPRLQQGRAELLAACASCFGHRLMMDQVRPGGIHAEPQDLEGLDAVLASIEIPSLRWPLLGVLPVATAQSLAPGGAVGRASGRLDPMHPTAAIDAACDLEARMQLRIEAMEGDLVLARRALASLPGGPIQAPLPHDTAEGLGLAEGPQGRVWHWVSLSGGLVAANFAADPAWLHLPACEAASYGAGLDTLPALAASFGLHLAGMDL